MKCGCSTTGTCWICEVTVLVLGAAGAAEAGGGCWAAELWTWVCKGVGEIPGVEPSGRLDGVCWVFPGRVPEKPEGRLEYPSTGAGLSCTGGGGKLGGNRVPGDGCGAGGCRMVSGTGSSLIPGPGEKGGTDGYIFTAVGADGGGDKGAGVTLGPPRKASREEPREAGEEKLSGELAPGLLGPVSPVSPPA